MTPPGKNQEPAPLNSKAEILPALAVLFSLVLLAAILGGAMRREISRPDIVSLANSVAAVNGDPSLADKIQFTLEADGRRITQGTYDPDGVCFLTGLSPQENYLLEIRRRDFKGRLLYKPLRVSTGPSLRPARYIVLVGASIGKAWNFEKIGKQGKGEAEIVCGFRARYDFDKSGEIRKLCNLPVPVSGVIIKECAAYFPRDLSSSQRLLQEWVNLLKGRGIQPILATTLSVTADHEARHPGRLASLLEYNDWLRDFARREKLLLLDLEKALRISDEDRHLRGEVAQSDGLHLVEEAYRKILDRLVINQVLEAKKEA